MSSFEDAASLQNKSIAKRHHSTAVYSLVDLRVVVWAMDLFRGLLVA
jgi:hypothetical protein